MFPSADQSPVHIDQKDRNEQRKKNESEGKRGANEWRVKTARVASRRSEGKERKGRRKKKSEGGMDASKGEGREGMERKRKEGEQGRERAERNEE